MSLRRRIAVRIDPSLRDPARVIGELTRAHLEALARCARMPLLRVIPEDLPPGSYRCVWSPVTDDEVLAFWGDLQDRVSA